LILACSEPFRRQCAESSGKGGGEKNEEKSRQQHAEKLKQESKDKFDITLTVKMQMAAPAGLQTPF
jgi:hypothetical protein